MLTGICAFAAIVRFADLTGTSLWMDDGYTIRIVVTERDNFLRPILADVHPPLYFLFLLGWTEVFGTGEWALRSFGAFLGLLTVPVMFAIGRLLGGANVGLTAALLLAASPLHVQYGAEVRMYGLLVLGAAVAIWGALRFAQEPGNARAACWGAVAYAFGAIVCAATQVTGLLALPGLSLLMILGWWRAGRPAAGFRAAFWAHLIIGAFLLAYTPLLRLFMENMNNLFLPWIPPPSPRVVAEVAGALLAQKLAGAVSLPVAAMAAAVLGSIALWGAWGLRRDALGLGFALLVGALPFALSIGLSLAVQPIFLLRVHIWAMLPLYALAAHAIAKRWSSGAGAKEAAPIALRAGFAAAFAVASAVGLHDYYTEPSRPDWRGLAAALREGLQPGDAVVAPPLTGSEPLLAYYAPNVTGTVRMAPASTDDLTRLAEEASLAPRVWFVSARWHDRVPPAAVGDALGQAGLRPAGPPREFRLLALQLWDRPESGG
ncbi:glycosyltransferase family 39 protein [Muricoccus radiodurans]|uniref:glycosyltransferase family 39 protein n=1 Tax=Muricoccus radiodurans TaxID=2231721 RepID=UPI003CE8C650